MEKDRGGRVLGIIAICIAVVGLSIAYASLSETLNISGTATVEGNQWSVHFVEGTLSEAAKVGHASVPSPDPITLGLTSVTLHNVTLVTPGDEVSYTFDVTNDGDLDAILGDFDYSIPVVTAASTGEDKTADEALVSTNLIYKLVYYNANPNNEVEVAENDTLTAGETKKLRLIISYNPAATSVPTADVTITNLGATLIYRQN